MKKDSLIYILALWFFSYDCCTAHLAQHSVQYCTFCLFAVFIFFISYFDILLYLIVGFFVFFGHLEVSFCHNIIHFLLWVNNVILILVVNIMSFYSASPRLSAFPRIALRTLHSPIYLLVVLAQVNQAALLAGLATFMAKFIERQFSQTMSFSTMMIGETGAAGILAMCKSLCCC